MADEDDFFDSADLLGEPAPSETPKPFDLQGLMFGDEKIFQGSSVRLADDMCALFVLFITSPLSKTAFQHVLDLLQLLLPENFLPTQVDEILSMFGASQDHLVTDDFCEDCSIIFKPADVVCSKCNVLRYAGGEGDQHKKKPRAFFLQLPMENDVRDLFQGLPCVLLHTLLHPRLLTSSVDQFRFHLCVWIAISL